MSETLFFDRGYQYSRQQYAFYKVEIDAERRAQFFRTANPSKAFYQETIFQPSDRVQLIQYISLVLKSLTDSRYFG